MATRSPGAGSREQRRAHIEQAALELFGARGFDHVTVEDICAEAGVAPATFYRHFGTKEEVVFSFRDDFAAALLTALDAAAELPVVMRLPVVISRFAEFLESQQDMLAIRDHIIMGHPRLLQRTLTIQRDWEGALAAGLARLRGLTAPDTAALTEAGVGLVVLRVALRSWRTQGTGSLLTITQQTLADLPDLVSRWNTLPE